MEDDPGLLVPQFWVNRTLEYSAQAAEYRVEASEPVLIRAFVLVADNKNRQKEKAGTITTTTNNNTDDAAGAVAQPILHARPMGGGSAGWTLIVMQDGLCLKRLCQAVLCKLILNVTCRGQEQIRK